MITESQPNSSSLGRLNVPRSEASAALNQRIASGLELSNRPLSSEGELRDAGTDRQEWRDGNQIVLQHLFSSPTIVETYTQIGRFSSTNSSLSSRANAFRTDTATYVARLKALLGNLDKFPEPQPAVALAAGSQQRSLEASSPSPYADRKKVFVIYGRNEAARQSLFSFLRAIGLEPLEWPQLIALTGQASPYVGEVLKAGLSVVQAVVAILTPDEDVTLRTQFRLPDDPPSELPQPRPNVLFELGLAMALYEERTIIVELGKVRELSDLKGRHVIRLNNSPGRRKELADRLSTAHCEVNTQGSDWLTAGNFDIQDVSVVAPSELQQQPLANITPQAQLDRMGEVFLASGYQAHSRASNILGSMCDDLERTSGAEKFVGILVRNSILEPSINAATRLRLALQGIIPSDQVGSVKLLELWSEFYKKYQEVRSHLDICGNVLGFQFTTSKPYQEFKEHDRDFLKELRKMLTNRYYRPLESEVDRVGWGSLLP